MLYSDASHPFTGNNIKQNCGEEGGLTYRFVTLFIYLTL